PLPLVELNSRVKTRMDANPEFQYVIEDTKRIKERLDKNSVSLNEKDRQKELDENKARSEARKEERKRRTETVATQNKQGFEQYRLTLDNVDASALVKESSFTKEQTTGMRMATSDDDDDAFDNSQFPFGIEPVKLETVNILRDLIEVNSHQPQTANTSEPKKPAGS
ncbi:MAG: carboxy terminal-processing peptidase, partial [Verrucomicrobium sp.]